ncbi:transglutaminase family protein [Paenarthrobacter ureafaciens]|jgi:transglutaminase-like putative cysteine protease|uniref:transglutaminase family protein n=1 Tax=Paenarthrobacter ureafaciens TaxID=37931 RepID=UPI00140BE233|nr:transglutaminase family protein [Paenarthrobacter ureafaciens]MCX8453902.1 transglutaminase family protein [Paenarthrobacter ureafaciens]MCY0971899.1 transglutaminase family protein [Paenarthrobacter ureafaciens]QQQ60805.1 transglutaminase family protein [Paenarthrobacter ureafaciens]
MTRLSIVHTTAYKYNRRVTLSYNEARMTPLTDSQQVVLESSLKVSPAHASVSTYRDYWGTRVTAFDMQVPHESLEVLATATVEVHRSERLPSDDHIVGWDQIRSAKIQDEFSDWLPLSRLTGPGTEVLGIIPGVVEGLNPHEAAMAVFAWMAGEMTYMKGTTGVTTNAEQAWEQRQGVCQDLAHLAIGALRSCGIPARYVSGYIHPRSSAAIGETVAGQSHAWLEWWDGEWRSWDPTNHKPAGDYHVTVAKGRDYRDVPPLKGILSGGGGSALSVSVEITRLA